MIAFLLAVATTCSVWADKTPVEISCHGAPKTRAAIVNSLCDALAEELGKRKPDRVVRHGTTQDALPKKAWHVVLEVTRTEDYHWAASLSWGKMRRGKDGKRTMGPDVEVFGMDALLGQGSYLHFIRSLLKVSKPAFLAPPKDATTPCDWRPLTQV